MEFIHALWTSDDNARWLDPPQGYEVDSALASGNLLVWDLDGPAGFAFLTEWLPRVVGLREFAVARPGQGRAFLEALMAEVFGPRGAHRLGLDCTADNARAMAFFQAAGFVREGVWRETWDRGDGDFVDCIFYSLLDREWAAR